MMRLLLTAGIALLLAGCAAQPVNFYEGAEKPAAEIATLAVGGVGSLLLANSGSFVRMVDGKPVDNFATRGLISHVKILPGEHIATVAYRQATSLTTLQYTKEAEIAFFAKPGHTYILNHRIIDNRVHYWIEEHG